MAQEKTFDLFVDQELIDSGLVRHLVPRFSFKTGVRITIVDAGGDAMLGTGTTGGEPAIEGDGRIYSIAVTGGNPHSERFRDWLLSEIGQRTIVSFVPEGRPGYTGAAGKVEVAVAPVFDGDLAKGAELSLLHCGRCHVIGEVNRMNGLGSTPSFAVLRTFADWDERFQSFYVLKPHAAFTQVAGVTEAFDPERPSPIYPVEMTLADLDEILAFVASISPADLGAPIQHQ